MHTAALLTPDCWRHAWHAGSRFRAAARALVHRPGIKLPLFRHIYARFFDAVLFFFFYLLEPEFTASLGSCSSVSSAAAAYTSVSVVGQRGRP